MQNTLFLSHFLPFPFSSFNLIGPLHPIMDLSSSIWDSLPLHLTELILLHLPIPSIIRASSVCKSWNSITHSSPFTTKVSKSNSFPWLFLSCNIFAHKNPVFAFIPKSDEWVRIENLPLSSQDSLTTSNGLFFVTNPEKNHFKTVFSRAYRHMTPCKLRRFDPLIGVFNDPHFPELHRFIVVGGNRYSGYIYMDDRQSVEIYDPYIDSWKEYAPLPKMFVNAISHQFLCSTVFKGKFYVLDMKMGFISFIELENHFWSNVQTLRPPGIMFSYLISCGDRLVLAGVCCIYDEPGFTLWEIDERTLEFREIGVMPDELSSCFFESGGEVDIKNWKCVGYGNVVYVFSRDRERNYQACICEIIGGRECRWRKIPNLPESFTYHTADKIVSLCCNVSIDDVLGKKLPCS